MFSEPRPCEHKDAWRVWNHLEALVPHPREVGHKGMMATQILSDGGLLGPTCRKARQRSDDLHARMTDKRLAKKLRRMDLVFGSLCVQHIFSNARRWASKRFLIRGPTKDINMLAGVVLAVQDSFKPIRAEIKRLVSEVLWDAPGDECEIATWWILCGHSENLAQHLAHLSVIFYDGRLHANAAFMDRPNILEEIAAALFSIARVTTFNRARWQSVCKTSCELIGCESVGLPLICERVRQIANQAYDVQAYFNFEEHLRTRERKFRFEYNI